MDIIIIVFVGIAQFLLKPIISAADASLPSGLTSSISTFSSWLSYFGHFFDLTAFTWAVSLLLIYEGVVLAIKLVTYIIRKIPGIS